MEEDTCSLQALHPAAAAATTAPVPHPVAALPGHSPVLRRPSVQVTLLSSPELVLRCHARKMQQGTVARFRVLLQS